jgi:glucose-1-phosphate thymidylyltransferase
VKVIIPLRGRDAASSAHAHHAEADAQDRRQPVIDYVMEDLQRLGNVEQVIYITGHLKDKVEEYARTKYPFRRVFIEQKCRTGTAGAVALARGARRSAGLHHLRRHDLRRDLSS